MSRILKFFKPLKQNELAHKSQCYDISLFSCASQGFSRRCILHILIHVISMTTTIRNKSDLIVCGNTNSTNGYVLILSNFYQERYLRKIYLELFHEEMNVKIQFYTFVKFLSLKTYCLYVTGFEKTNQVVTFCISRNTILKH